MQKLFSTFGVILLALFGLCAPLRAQISPTQIRLTKIFGHQQTGPSTITEFRPQVDASISFNSNVPTTWTLSLSSPTGANISLSRDPRSLAFATTYLGSATFTTLEELNQRVASGSYYLYVFQNGAGANGYNFSTTFGTELPPTYFEDFNALQTWDGERRTVSWRPIPDPSSDETRVFTLERADGTVVFDTRTDGLPLYNGSTSVEIPAITSKVGDVFYGTLTYTRLLNSNSTGFGASVSTYQSFRVRVPIKRPPPPAPFITTQPQSISALVGSTVSFSVTATGEALSYVWLKNGVAISGATSATFTIPSLQTSQAGSYTVSVTNSGGTVTSEVATLTIAPSLLPPILISFTSNQTVSAGSAVTFRVTNGGTAPFTYQWLRNGTPLTGATSAALTLDPVTPADAGIYSVRVSNAVATIVSSGSTLTVRAIAPALVTNLGSVTVLAGAKVILGVTVNGTAPFTYQWARDGVPVTGATDATFVLNSAIVADSAAYRVTVTNSAGSITSSSALLTVTPISRISNLSVLTSLSAPDDNFTLGYVVGGAGTTGPKPLVLRAAGPALGALGVGGTLDDPKLETFAGSTKTGENDDWAGTPSLSSAFTAVGAFPFATPTSRDAAISTSLTTRDNSVKISAASSATGLVIAEIYDASPDTAFIATTPRLLNVSVLKSLGTGLTVGFTVAGSSAKSILLRAVGPTLTDFGVAGAVADPVLTLYNSASAKITENDNWGGTAQLTAAFTSVGAFALPATSRDAALLATLPPGGYSVQVSGVNNTTGVALVEVYEVP